MGMAKEPKSLRGMMKRNPYPNKSEMDATAGVALACLAVVGTTGTAEAQQTPGTLPAVTVDAPRQRARPVVTQQVTPARATARKAVRRAARQRAPVVAQPSPSPASGANLPILARAPGANPYADPRADYKVDRLQSPKFTEPLLNTPRTVTVLTKEVLEDKNATSLKEVARSTAGVTLGTGEGGNAFGDRFFIRGFDARNDIFVDGVRDPAVSIRENFFTEQVEILRGPASSFAGRGTTGGAINIVTKQAQDKDFYRFEGQGGIDDQNKRVTVDLNKAISPILAVRLNALYQDSHVAGREFVTDNRNGVAGAVKFQPITPLIITANYSHTYLSGIPDFGVPTNNLTKRPVTEGLIPRNQFYGFVNRDFTRTQQNLGTLNAEYKVNNSITLNTKFRQEYSGLNYVGTIPEAPNVLAGTTTLNPQSRLQNTDVLANQTDATVKFDTGPIKNTSVFGTEVSHERVSYGGYSGLNSEALPGGFNGTGSLAGASIFNPPNLLPFNSNNLQVNPTRSIINVDTAAGYVMQTANYNDFIIANGGVRYDDYNINARNTTAANGPIKAHSGLIDYNFGLVIKPTPASSLYAAYATGSQPVGAELDGSSATYGALNPNSTVNQVFGPQRSTSAEVGAKYEAFDRRLLTSLAFFQTNVTNARETATVNGIANTVIAGAAYKVNGIDLEAEGKITDRWSVLGGLVLLSPHVTNSYIATNVGLPLANVATRSFTLLTKYQLTDWLELGGQAVYRSQLNGGTLLAANQGTVLPSYWRFDLFGEIKAGPNTTFKVFAQNIFNRTYYDAFYQSAAPFVLVAPGRAITFAAVVKF
jgi:catecholate siderophore receptor